MTAPKNKGDVLLVMRLDRQARMSQPGRKTGQSNRSLESSIFMTLFGSPKNFIAVPKLQRHYVHRYKPKYSDLAVSKWLNCESASQRLHPFQERLPWFYNDCGSIEGVHGQRRQSAMDRGRGDCGNKGVRTERKLLVEIRFVNSAIPEATRG